MKKIIAVCLCLLCIFPAVSCAPYEKHGLSNYHPMDSNFEITQQFFPTENSDFLDMFDYVWGDYHYYESPLTIIKSPYAKAIAVLKYEQNVYWEAKQYCLDHMYLSSTNIKEYNGYMFSENLAFAKENDSLEDGENTDFPGWFTMMAYNDSLNTLVFIGFYCTYDDDPDAAYAETDFGKFLDIFFSEYYDFNAK